MEDDIRRAAVGPEVSTPATTGEPLPAARRILADSVRNWLAATAQYTLTSEVDVTELAVSGMPWTAAVVRACAVALRHQPRLASRWQGDRLVPAESLDIGVLVSIEDGLVVPVVRRADSKTVPALAAEITKPAERAPGDQRRHWCRVCGVQPRPLPIDAFTPLIYPPGIAILGVGRARPDPPSSTGGSNSGPY